MLRIKENRLIIETNEDPNGKVMRARLRCVECRHDLQVRDESKCPVKFCSFSDLIQRCVRELRGKGVKGCPTTIVNSNSIRRVLELGGELLEPFIFEDRGCLLKTPSRSNADAG